MAVAQPYWISDENIGIMETSVCARIVHREVVFAYT